MASGGEDDGLPSTIGKFLDQFRPVTGPDCKSRWRQLYEVFSLGARWRFTPREYDLYRFYEKGHSLKDMATYLSNREVSRVYRPILNDQRWVPILGNKWLFHHYYHAFGVPVTNVYGYYRPGHGTTVDGRPLSSPTDLRRLLDEVRPSTLVVKPVGGLTAKGVVVFSRVDYPGGGSAPTFEAIDGRRFSFDDLVRHLGEDPGELIYKGYLFEEKLAQHPFIDEINPYTINTFRVVTFKDADVGVGVQRVILRLGRRGNPTDAWNKGGLSVFVDPATGMLGQGIFKPKYGRKPVGVHPDTGVTFANRQVPMWDKVVEACTLAARVSPELKAIGWDVVLTPDGPVIIEGNHNWDMTMMQVHGGYLQPDVAAALDRYGLRFRRG